MRAVSFTTTQETAQAAYFKRNRTRDVRADEPHRLSPGRRDLNLAPDVRKALSIQTLISSCVADALCARAWT